MRILIPSLLAIVTPLAHANASPPDIPTISTARASDSSSDQVVQTVTDEKVVCRRDKEIGSRVRARTVCMTAKQWAAKAAEERVYLETRQAQRTLSE